MGIKFAQSRAGPGYVWLALISYSSSFLLCLPRAAEPGRVRCSHHNPGDLQGRNTTAWSPDPAPPTPPHFPGPARPWKGLSSYVFLWASSFSLRIRFSGWMTAGGGCGYRGVLRSFPQCTTLGAGPEDQRQGEERVTATAAASVGPRLPAPPWEPWGWGRVSLRLAPLLTSKEIEPRDRARNVSCLHPIQTVR